MSSLFLIAILMLLIVGGWILVLLPFFLVAFVPFAITGYYSFYFLSRIVRVIVHSDIAVTMAQIVENGNPIVGFATHFPLLRLQRISLLFPEQIRGRRQVGELLTAAQGGLLDGYFFLVRECYRSAGVNRVDTDNHMNSGNHTGGSFDVTLCDKNGKELDLGFRNLAKLNWLGRPSEGIISVKARSNRKILYTSLKKAGFANNPLEWWSWSYGDKFWSVVKKTDSAIYGELVA